jgi:hypothetical protein
MRWDGWEKEWTPHESWVCACGTHSRMKKRSMGALFVLAWQVDGWLQRWLDSCRFEDPAQYLHGQKLHAAAFEFMSVEALPLNEVDFFFHCDVSGWLTRLI